MEVILIMCAGILISKIYFPIKWKRVNELLQLVCTLLLIFSMGVLLGSRDDFLTSLSELGAKSFLFFLLPSAFSVIAVYPLTKLFLEKKSRKEED